MSDIGNDIASAYEDGQWDMFLSITSADFGKQIMDPEAFYGMWDLSMVSTITKSGEMYVFLRNQTGFSFLPTA